MEPQEKRDMGRETHDNTIQRTKQQETIPQTRTNRNTNRRTNGKKIRSEDKMMTKEEEEKLKQGIRLAKGKTEKEAEKEVNEIKRMKEKAEEIERWTKEEERKGNEKAETLLISSIIMKYNRRKRDRILRTIHRATVTEYEQLEKEAKIIKELGEMKKQWVERTTK